MSDRIILMDTPREKQNIPGGPHLEVISQSLVYFILLSQVLQKQGDTIILIQCELTANTVSYTLNECICL